ncbi:hypothetical protein RIF29_39086 [Crotalaria pallida]|uniref:Uncharacterized protein n=1 Tax=Crotalaria pallida TaxID=3830 RepID=A0AAN9E6T3_CROPI
MEIMEAKKQRLQNICALDDPLIEAVEYYKMKTSQFSNAMASDPSYSELMANDQFAFHPAQHLAPLQAQHGLPILSNRIDDLMLSGLGQQSYTTTLPPFGQFDQPYGGQGGPNFSNSNNII